MLTAYIEANWARNASDGGSTSGGVLVHRSHYHQELEQDAIAHRVIFGRVQTVWFGEGERRGNGFSVGDQDLGQSWSMVVFSDANTRGDADTWIAISCFYRA